MIWRRRDGTVSQTANKRKKGPLPQSIEYDRAYDTATDLTPTTKVRANEVPRHNNGSWSIVALPSSRFCLRRPFASIPSFDVTVTVTLTITVVPREFVMIHSSSHSQIKLEDPKDEEEQNPLIDSTLKMSSDRDDKKKSTSFVLRNYNSRRRLPLVIICSVLALILLYFTSKSMGNSK